MSNDTAATPEVSPTDTHPQHPLDEQSKNTGADPEQGDAVRAGKFPAGRTA